MTGEAEPRLHGAAEREADLLRGGETERGLGSSPCRHEGEPRVSLSRSLSFASASDVSFLSGVTSSSSSSLRSDVESDDGDAMYPWTQSEYEEIPSFRWIATPLRWWKTSRRTHPSKRSSAAGAASGGEEPGPTGRTEVGSDRETSTKLVHFDGHHAFTLRELLRADAEVLGRGNYGTVYRATLEDGKQVAVRRLTGVETAKDFVAAVNVLGKIRHPNVLALRAYYYSPEEKFLVFDYMPRGSLSAFLHARCPHTPIDWPTRMSIAIGSTRGLHYLHTKGNMVHGNLTSGNVLLDYHVNAKIANYGLSKLLTTAVNFNEMVTAWSLGYHAPELSSLEKANTKTDVYSLGVIVLELLTGKSPRGLDLGQWIASFTEEMTTRREFRDTLNLALNCADPSPNARPDLQQVLQQLEEINSNLARATCAFATNGGNKPTDEGAGAAGITAIVAPATDISLDMAEERTATPFEDAEEGTPDTSSVLPTDENLLRSRATENIVSSPLASPASGAEAMPTPINSCKDKDEELAESTSRGDPGECDEIPSPTPAEEITRDPSGNEELQAPSLGDCFINLSTVQPEVKDGASFPSFNMDEPMAEDRTGERMGTEGIDAMSGGTVASPLSSIDWAKVTIEVPLEVPTSPSLISSDPDSGYQRYFQTLYDLARRSPPLPSNVLEVQLNKMIMGLHSLGYPLDTWLKAATLVLLFAKKREYIEQHVDDHKVHVEAQLKEFASAIAPVEEGISRTQSDISTLERKQEELDETIAKLEDQLSALKTQREEVLDSLTMARDQLVAAEAKMESVAVDMDRLNQHYSAIRDLQSAMMRELPSLDEAFDSGFREIMARKF